MSGDPLRERWELSGERHEGNANAEIDAQVVAAATGSEWPVPGTRKLLENIITSLI